MRFVVAHSGARHNYAVPLFLAQAEMLERFYTDICGNVGLGKVLAQGQYLPGVGSGLRRLAGRRVPQAVHPFTHTFALPYLCCLAQTALSSKDQAEAFRFACQKSIKQGEAMARSGFGQATHLYSMLGEFSPLLIAAAESGLTIVSEVYIILSSDKLLAQERQQFPGWEIDSPDYDDVQKEFLIERPLLTRSHFFICPSQAVQDDLIANFGVQRHQTRLVPFGVNPAWLETQSQPIPRRVLFVGTANLRKGIHYLAIAAERLRHLGHRYEFRVAGDVTSSVLDQPQCKYLTFLGRIPRDRIQHEFATADIFVLPSLAEGSAMATYEAMAAKLPVVVTPGAGSVARNGIEGYVVPERDPIALAEAIASIIEDRTKRECMAQSAQQRAREYTWDSYSGKLVSTLKTLHYG